MGNHLMNSTSLEKLRAPSLVLLRSSSSMQRSITFTKNLVNFEVGLAHELLFNEYLLHYSYKYQTLLKEPGQLSFDCGCHGFCARRRFCRCCC